MRNGSDSQKTGMFLLGGGLVMAHQVAGKAVRGGLFLSQFSPGDLPKVVGRCVATAGCCADWRWNS